MTFEEIRKSAVEMRVPVKVAVEARIKWLYRSIETMVDDFEEIGYSELVQYYTNRDLQEMIDLKHKLLNWQLECEHVYYKGKRIDETKIQVAREFPIDQLIDFKKGFALARCHEDTKPSLHHDKKHNRAHCFVCDRNWNPIDWMMEFEGMDFMQAVVTLMEGATRLYFSKEEP